MAELNIDATPATPCTAPGGDIWNVAGFRLIEDIIGPDKAQKLLSAYVAQLGYVFASVRERKFDATQMRETAHDLKSTSGQLGFEALQICCEKVLAAKPGTASRLAVEPLMTLIAASCEAARSYHRQSEFGNTQRAVAERARPSGRASL